MLYLNGQPVPVTMFPDKTSQVWKLPENAFKNTGVHILWKFENEGEFFHLAQLKALLDKKQIHAWLELSYLPYARQDKEVSNETTFALSVFAKHLNHLKFSKVKIHDPHSSQAMTRIHHVEAVYPGKALEDIAQSIGGDVIFCYPDAGALKKYSTVYQTLYRPHIYGEKVRHQLTGHILSYKVIGECIGKNVLIVDDICDGGATFKILAKDLLASGATGVNLFVTHGIFSQGVKTLFESGISRVFTKNGEVARPE